MWHAGSDSYCTLPEGYGRTSSRPPGCGAHEDTCLQPFLVAMFGKGY